MVMINSTEYQIQEIPTFPGYLKFEPVTAAGYFDIANDQDMLVVDTWCQEHKCGKRSGFNKFFFNTDEEITMFKLKWS
jgi:hypothetical protein